MCSKRIRRDRWIFALLCAIGCALLHSSPVGARLLVASQGDGRVLEYDEGNGNFVAPFVEPITEGFVFPGGIAVRPSDGQLYVASTASGEIWRYDTPTGLVVAPAVTTGLLAPGALAFDAGGSNLYFLADIPNGPNSDAALRRLTLPGATVTTLASDANASFAGLALEGSFVYVSDSFGGTVIRYPITGGNGTVVVSGLTSPAGILFLSSSVMLIADSGADSVVEFHESGGTWSFDREVLGPSAGLDGPAGLAIAPDGRLSISGSLSNDVFAIDLTTLTTTPLVASGNGLAVPGQLQWDDTTLLVASRSSNTIPYFESSGTPTGTVARGLTAPADSGMARTSAGHLLVASAGANSVTEYDGNTGATLRSLPNACPSSFTQPFDVGESASGEILVSCTPTDGVRRFDAIGSSVPFVTAGSGGLSSPRGFSFGPNGNLFVSSLTGEVLEYDGSNGSFVGVFVDATGNGGGPIDPYGLRFHRGSLFVASNFPNEVREFDATTGAFIGAFVTSGSGGLSGPNGLAFGADGDLYVTSSGDDTIKRYDGANGSFVESFVTSGSGGLDQPFDLEFVAPDQGPSVPMLAPVSQSVLVLVLVIAGATSRSRRNF